MRTFRKTMLSTLLTPVALLAMTPAGAQSAAPPAAPQEQDEAVQQLDTIVVTGIRGSLEAARDIKRDSAQIVDAIVADDIGKLPDTNVAESLSRVSGVQIDRGIGEGSDISIRGLRENVVLYNGRQIVDSTGRGGNGLDQLGTSTYGLLSLVPSELISRLTVTKLAGAEQIAGALGGIVDIETRLPLSSDGLQVAASAAATYDELADEPGFETFGLISQTFADNRFGALLTASYSERSLAQQGLDTFSGYARFNDPTTTLPTPRFGHADVRAQNIAEDRDKVGLSGVLQWRPADGVEIVADTFYSKLTSERDRHWLSFNPTAGLSNARYSDNDILLSGRATGPVLSNTEFADIESEVWSTALRGSFRVGERLGASAEISHGRSESFYKQIYLRLQPIATITPTVDFDLTAGDFGSFAINGIDLTDPNQLRYTILFDNLYRSETETFAARSDWSLDFDSSWLRSLDFGARYSTLETVQNPLRADIRPAGGIPANQLGGFLTTYRNDDFLPGEFANLPRSYLAGLRDTLTGCAAFTAFPAVSQNSQCLDPANNTNALASTFDIDETFLEGYAKLNFDTDLGAMRLSGNVGVRFIDRDLESAGNLISGTGAATPAVFQRNDDEWLPSAVAKLDVTENFVVRAGAARVLAFPQHRGSQQRPDPVQQRGVRRQRRTDQPGHRQRRRAGPGSVPRRPAGRFAGVLLRRAGAGLGRAVPQGRVQLHRAAPERRNLWRGQLPDQPQDQRRRRDRAGRRTAGAGAFHLPAGTVRWLRHGRHLFLHRFGDADPRHLRPRAELSRPVEEQRQPDRLLRARPVQRAPRLQLAR